MRVFEILCLFPCLSIAHVWLYTLYKLSPNVVRLRISNWIESRGRLLVVGRCDKRPNQATCVQDQQISTETAMAKAFQQAAPAASASEECRVANRSTLAKMPQGEGDTPRQGAWLLALFVSSLSRADAPLLVDPGLLANRSHSSRICKSTTRRSLLSPSPAERPPSAPRSPHAYRRCALPQPSIRQARATNVRDKRARQTDERATNPR